MLSAAGKSKTISLAPPPSGAVKVRSPLPPPPNDQVATRMKSSSRDSAVKGANENSRNSSDPLSDLSALEVYLIYLHHNEVTPSNRTILKSNPPETRFIKSTPQLSITLSIFLSIEFYNL